MPELMSNDRAALDGLLASSIVGTVAFVDSAGLPGVIPTAVARMDDCLIVHGSTGSRWMRLVPGCPAVISVTAVDGVIVARSAFESSLAYRSAVVFGSFQTLEGLEKKAALHVMTNRLIPGRTEEVRPSTVRELAATLVLAMPLTQWSLRVSAGWPQDAADDVAGPAWAGHVMFAPKPPAITPVPGLRSDIRTPASVAKLRDTH